MSEQKKRVGILSSGNSTDFVPIINSLQQERISADLACVITLKDSSVHQSAEMRNLPVLTFTEKEFKNNKLIEKNFFEEFWSKQVELIILCDYNKILSKTFIDAYKERIIAVQPSLLPAFSGRNMFRKNIIISSIC